MKVRRTNNLTRHIVVMVVDAIASTVKVFVTAAGVMILIGQIHRDNPAVPSISYETSTAVLFVVWLVAQVVLDALKYQREEDE